MATNDTNHEVIPENPSARAAEKSSLTDDEVGIAIGGALCIVILLGLLLIGCRQRRQKDRETPRDHFPTLSKTAADETVDEHFYELDKSFSFSSLGPNGQKTRPTAPILAVRVAVRDISLDTLIARGTTSEIYRGQYRDRLVAIKKPFPEWLAQQQQKAMFFTRVQVFASLGMAHPCVVAFVGVAWTSRVYVCLVTEYMAQGDLYSFVRRTKHAEFCRHGYGRTKLELLSPIAQALSFFHAQGLVHGAIRSRKILLDANLTAKLSGYPTRIETLADRPIIALNVAERLRRQQQQLDALWSAPEVLRGEKSNAKTDVFSFGVVLAELDAGTREPYAYKKRGSGQVDRTELLAKIAAGHVVVHFASSKSRGQDADLEARVTQAVVRLGKACVVAEAFERPSAAEIATELHNLLQLLKRK